MAQLQDLSNDFKENRSAYFHKQIVALQHDMNLITQADPYSPEPLDDSPDAIAGLIGVAAAGTPYQSEMSSLAGKWYSEFVQEINQAKEARDIELTQLMVGLAREQAQGESRLTIVQNEHQERLDRIKHECDYRLHLAATECDYLAETLRQRLVQQLSSRKQRLMREKEQLDIADTNTLLLHPSQFSITNPSSPGGGGQTNRKTRHARHRIDVEELGNGLAIEGTNRRKRRAFEDDLGSPSRDGFSTPAERAKAKMQAHQTAPLYSIHSLFTEKELNLQSHQAHIATRHFFSTSKNGIQTNGADLRAKDQDEQLSGSGDESNQEEDDGLAAPDMERTASQNFHVTRSTRNTGGPTRLDILSDVAVANRPQLPYATLHNYQPRNGAALPAVSQLIQEEVEEDQEKLRAVMNELPGHMDEKLVDEALKPASHTRSTLAPDWPTYLDVHLVDMKRPVD
jgi:Sds3-like